jgi:DNA-binding response OmpR family regulator
MSESKILIIDDEKSVCDVCSQLFSRDGYSVESSYEGTSGLEKFEDFKPDVVFIDLRMPGMDGMEVLEKIKEKDKDVVTIMITAYATVEAAVESMKKGAFDFLPKPFTEDKLRSVLKKALKKRKKSRGSRTLHDPNTVVEKGRLHSHIADLVAFVKPLDLPPSLQPFARSAGWKRDMFAENDARFAVFKIRGTMDSYHALMIKNGADINQVEHEIHQDLEIVELSDETRERLKILLDKLRHGEFTYYVNHKVDMDNHPYRH